MFRAEFADISDIMLNFKFFFTLLPSALGKEGDKKNDASTDVERLEL